MGAFGWLSTMGKRWDISMPTFGTPKKTILRTDPSVVFVGPPVLAIRTMACLRTMPPKLCANIRSGLVEGLDLPIDFILVMKAIAMSSIPLTESDPTRAVSYP